MNPSETTLAALERDVPECRRCARLADFQTELRERCPGYWNRPVPGFGDRRAWLAIIGLAPGLHGANRSGRPFWLDSSGEWLYGELERRGLFPRERLDGVYVTNAVKCVPPANRPLPLEVGECRPWLARELEALPEVRVVLALGQIAQLALLNAWRIAPRARPKFAHGAEARLPARPILLTSYHPSRQNTNTGVLTRAMWSAIFARALALGGLRSERGRDEQRPEQDR